MSDKKQKSPGTVSKTLKLFFWIFVVLLVPVVMDQAEVDRETVRLIGRVAAGLTVLMVIYGLFAKLMKMMVFVVLALITMVVLVSEGKVKAPRLTDWWTARSSDK